MKPSQNFSVHFRLISNLEIQKIRNSKYLYKFSKIHRILHYERSYKDMMMHAFKSTLIPDLYITNATSCSKIER